MNALKWNEYINETWLNLENCNILWNVCTKQGWSLDYLDNGERMISRNDTHIAVFKECENAVFYFMSKSDPLTEEKLLAWEEERLLSQEYERFQNLTPEQLKREYEPELAPITRTLMTSLTKTKPTLIPHRIKHKTE